jgi:hypothetical protein
VCTTPANGTSISTWQDESGNAGDATKNAGTATYNTNQINGIGGVTISNNSTNFSIGGSITSVNLHTLFVVYKPLDYNQGVIIGGGSTFGYFRDNQANRQRIVAIGNPGNVAIGSNSVLANAWHQVTIQETGPLSGPGFTTLLHLDQAVDTVSATASTNANMTPPNHLFWETTDACCAWSAEFAAILYYNDQLNATDILANECYLYGKYRAGPATGGIQLTNYTTGDSGGSAVSTIAADAQNAVAGNLMVVGIRPGSSATTVTSVTDTAMNTYTQCPSARSNTSASTDIWYAKNITGNSANVVTANLSGATSFSTIAAMQYSGANASSPQDTAANGHATGTSVTTGSFTPAGAGEVAVAMASNNSGAGTWTAGTGYVLRAVEVTSNTISEDSLISTGAQTASITFGSSSGLDLSVCVFKP